MIDTEARDVVACLEQHQANLLPDAMPPRHILLALPAPRLCRMLVPEVFDRIRQSQLDQIAEELGGGNGPLPVADLDVEMMRLSELIDRLESYDVNCITVHGAVDQPGWVRALAYRWSRQIQFIDDDPQGRHSALSMLMDDLSPVRWLSEDVVRLRGDEPAPEGARVVLRGRLSEPARETDHAEEHPYVLDPERRLGPWSGILPYEATLGTAHGARLRAEWLRRGPGDGSAVRHAVLGLDPELDARLFEPLPERVPNPAPNASRIFVVAGVTGAGKTRHADEWVQCLRASDHSAQAFEIHRHGGFLELANELGARTRQGAPLAAFRVSRVVKLIDSLRVLRDILEPALRQLDAVVMDRYLETHIAAGRSQLGWDLTDHPLLAAFPAAHHHYWLRLPIEEALARLEQRDGSPAADEHPVGLRGYVEEFDALACGPRHTVLDSRDDFETNARVIADTGLKSMPVPEEEELEHERNVDFELEVMPAAALQERGRRRVLIGSAADWGAPLGEDIFGLRSYLARRVGEPAARVNEQFWIEAYVAQQLLDVQTRTDLGSQASMPLWPGALRRMREFRDLSMLAELERMLELEVDVALYSENEGNAYRAFRNLGALPAAARRLARSYQRELQVVAIERDWRGG